jgi:hypothetical protein
MGKQRPTTKPVQASDPLADVRAAFGGTDEPPVATTAPESAPDQPEPEGAPLATVDDRLEARAAMIAAWHADPVALGFLHRGGRCGCRYLAERALDAVAPLQGDEDPEG